MSDGLKDVDPVMQIGFWKERALEASEDLAKSRRQLEGVARERDRLKAEVARLQETSDSLCRRICQLEEQLSSRTEDVQLVQEMDGNKPKTWVCRLCGEVPITHYAEKKFNPAHAISSL